MATILLLSGPNLAALGRRDPRWYGAATLDDCVRAARAAAEAAGHVLEHVQSNHEGALIDAVHAAVGQAAAIVVNAGALTHTSRALADALGDFDGVKVEVHLSNPYAREPWRRRSVLAEVVDGMVAGFRQHGYRLAVEAAAALLEERDR